MAYEIEGTVHQIDPAQVFASGFTKRVFVIEVEAGKYPQMVSMEALQDKAALLDDIRVGDLVRVKFDVRGREYNGKFFNTLVAWSITTNGSGKSTNDKAATGKPTAAPAADDDIPF